MSGSARARHRSSARKSGAAPVIGVLAAALVGSSVVVGVTVAMRNDHSSSPSCGSTVALAVSTTPQLAVPLGKVASDYNAAHQTVDGRCVTVKVTASPTSATVAALATGWTAGSAGNPPDVWVPESSAWLTLAQSSPAAARLLPSAGTTIASSPTVIAMPQPMAQAAGWPQKQMTWSQMATNEGDAGYWSRLGHADWGPFAVGYADPATSIASLDAVVGMAAASQKTTQASLTTASFLQNRAVQLSVLNVERKATAIPATQDDLLAGLARADASGKPLGYLSAIPMQESTLVAYDKGLGSATGQAPKTRLVASYPTDGLVNNAVPYVVLKLAAGDPVRAAATRSFLSAVSAPAGQADLTAAGFRTPSGINASLTAAVGAQPTLTGVTQQAASGDVLTAAQAFFGKVHQRGATLAVVDTSGSMADIVPGTGQTKLQIVINALLQGVTLFARNDRVGLWQFSADMGGGLNYRPLSPVVPLYVKGRYGTHYDDLVQLKDVVTTAAGNTALYQVTLEAYKDRMQNYVPGVLNQVVLVTDGVNDDPGDPKDLSLPSLLQQLGSLYNPKKPIRIITIAYGKDADPAVLKQISDVTHAKSYQSRNPSDILNVFIDAITDTSS